MMVIFSDLERVLSTDQLFMLGPWLRSARQRATTELVRLHNGLPDGQSPEMHMLRPGTWQGVSLQVRTGSCFRKRPCTNGTPGTS